MFAKSTVAVALLASFVAAQTSGNTTINPSEVEPALRSQWCAAEINTCGTLCSGLNDANSCDPGTLNFTCTCQSNGSAPGLQYYTQTMPTFICQQIYQDCILAGQNNQAAQRVCTQNRDNNCGTIDPTNFTATSSSSSSSATTATPTSSTASGTAALTSTSKAAAATMAAIGRDFGSGIVAAGVAAAFGLMI